MIAMAIANDPDVLIADEPTTALDVTVQAQILEVIKEAQLATEAAVVFITHDLGVIARLADRVQVMYAGRVAELGGVDDIFAHPRHPYTAGLLHSLPKLDGSGVGERLLPDPGGAAFDGQPALGLRVPSPVPAGPGGLLGRDAQPAVHRATPVIGVPLRRGGRAPGEPTWSHRSRSTPPSATSTPRTSRPSTSRSATRSSTSSTS